MSAESFDAGASYSERPEQAGFDRLQYRWRPLDGEEPPPVLQWPEYATVNERNLPAYHDYADTPPGLPRGVYRPVRERHKITPHHQGYRFRPLSPAEQVRIKERNSAARDGDKQPGLVFRSQRQAVHGRDSTVSRQSRYRFRPDKRLDAVENGRAPYHSRRSVFRHRGE